MAPAIMITIFLYWLRGYKPFIYGTVEVVVGSVTMWAGFHTENAGLLLRCLGLAGGIYIVVRGLDNMDKALPESWRAFWERWFPKTKPRETIYNQ